MPDRSQRIEERIDVPWWHAWLETGLLSAAVPVCSALAGSADPFFCRAPFCWPLLGPLLAGLRYGFLHGVVGAAALVGVMETLDGSHVSGQLASAILVVAMLTGELSDHWQRRVARAERIARLAARRTNGFVRAYHALTVSHDRLQTRLQSSEGTLREALSALSRRLCTGVIGVAERDEVRAMVLELFAEFGAVQLASFHVVDCRGQAQPASVSLGNVRTDPRHPMIAESVRRRMVVSLGPDRAGGAPEDPLVVVPLATSENEVVGVISIVEMPFVNLNEETLQRLAVLGGRVADLLSDFQRPDPLTDEKRFVRELRRSVIDRRQHGLPSSIGALSVAMPESAVVVAEASADRRATDKTWLTVDVEGEPVLVVLLPLTSGEGAACFARRTEAVVRARYGGLLPEQCVQLRTREIRGGDSVESLLSFARTQAVAAPRKKETPRPEGHPPGRRAVVRRPPPPGGTSLEAT